MNERKILEVLQDIASWQFQLTGDKWWADLGVKVNKKLNGK